MTRLEKTVEGILKRLGMLQNRLNEIECAKVIAHTYYGTAQSSGTSTSTFVALNYCNTIGSDYEYSDYITRTSASRLTFKKAGLYMFNMRFQYASTSANARVSVQMFNNGTRIAHTATTWSTPTTSALTTMITLAIDVAENDYIEFKVLPAQATAVNCLAMDTLITKL